MNTNQQTIAIFVLVMSLGFSGCAPAQLSGSAFTPTITAFPTLAPTAIRVSSPTATIIPPTLTPVPPTVTATPTPPSTGIRGTVNYTGIKLGSIIVFVSTGSDSISIPTGQEATKSFKDISGGEFGWGLPAGSYYVAALLQVEGSQTIETPFITCGPIEVRSNELVKIENALTDATMYGKPRDCGMKTP
jgi:hypothetical protein